MRVGILFYVLAGQAFPVISVAVMLQVCVGRLGGRTDPLLN